MTTRHEQRKIRRLQNADVAAGYNEPLHEATTECSIVGRSEIWTATCSCGWKINGHNESDVLDRFAAHQFRWNQIGDK